MQDNDPIAHAEIGCLRNAGRLGSFRDTVLLSTLIPCYLCAGAVVQFEVRKVIVRDSRTFAGVADFMRNYGVEVNDLDLQECAEMMTNFIAEHRQLWDEEYRSLGNRRNTVAIRAVTTTTCSAIKPSLVLLLP